MQKLCLNTATYSYTLLHTRADFCASIKITTMFSRQAPFSRCETGLANIERRQSFTIAPPPTFRPVHLQRNVFARTLKLLHTEFSLCVCVYVCPCSFSQIFYVFMCSFREFSAELRTDARSDNKLCDRITLNARQQWVMFCTHLRQTLWYLCHLDCLRTTTKTVD